MIAWYILGFIAVLSPIILVHEFGHFWTAKKFGIHVEEFGLGFPPRAVKLFERNGTIYSLNWIPLGGFVRPAGEDDPTTPGGLASASKTARFCVLVAGAVANFILAFFVLWGAFLIGPPAFDETRIAVSGFQDTNVAEAAGLAENDVFVVVDGVVIGDDIPLLQDTIGSNLGREIELVMERDGETYTTNVVPQPSGSDETRGALGIGLGAFETGERNPMPVGAAAAESLNTIWRVIDLTVSAPAMLARGELTAQEARPISPVGISQIVGAQAQSAVSTGDWFNVIFFAGIINVGLGFTNLLPLPALDGGRILFVLIEAIRGRRVSAEREGLVHMVGMLLLLSLMALLMINDVINPIPF